MNVSMVTLGVEDLARSRRFYAALGWRERPMGSEEVAFMGGADVVLGLYGREALAADAGVDAAGSGFRGVALALNRSSAPEVDDFMRRATLAGATLVKRPAKVFWGGYSGYFADPDGHLWEVAHNPFVETDGNGRWTPDTDDTPLVDTDPTGPVANDEVDDGERTA